MRTTLRRAARDANIMRNFPKFPLRAESSFKLGVKEEDAASKSSWGGGLDVGVGLERDEIGKYLFFVSSQ